MDQITDLCGPNYTFIASKFIQQSMYIYDKPKLLDANV